MSHSESESTNSAESWNAYWAGIGESGAHDKGGVTHPSIHAFWKAFFLKTSQDLKTPKILDIASGNGPLIPHIHDFHGVGGADISCVDLSEAAITSIVQRFPGVRGIHADAASIPLDSGSFDVVVSQFGLEYAGSAAVDEAARLLADGGRMALVFHQQDSAIHHEGRAALDAIHKLQESQFISLASSMFRAAFDAIAGGGGAEYKSAAAALMPAINSLEDIMREHGKHVAGDTVFALYNGVADIHGAIAKYDPAEVFAWLDRMDAELVSFAARMESMLESVVDYEQFTGLTEKLERHGVVLTEAGPLLDPDENVSLAWAIIANRPQASAGGET